MKYLATFKMRHLFLFGMQGLKQESKLPNYNKRQNLPNTNNKLIMISGVTQG